MTQQNQKRGSYSQNNKTTIPETGKLLPQAIDLEEAILGSCMIQIGAYDEIAHIIEPDTFYKESHRLIFKAIQQLSMEKKPIDIMTVTQELKEKGDLDIVGGPVAVTMLTSRIATSAHMVYHAYVVYEKYIMREMVRLGSDLVAKAFEDDFDALKSTYASGAAHVDHLLAGKRTDKSMMQVMKDHMAEVDNRIKLAKLGQMPGISTGLTQLDQYTNGWKPGELIVLAARPSMGKTAVALNLFTKSAAHQKKNILFFSLEMDDISLADRLVCSYGGIVPDHLKQGTLSSLELEKYHQSSAELQQLPISIDDTARADLIHINAISRSKRRKGLCDLIVIDYLQLIESPKENKAAFKNREREVSELSRGLKLLAKELKIPIILLAQLSRAVESRPGTLKRPILSDLRESGAIEQDADMVIFPYRPEYYGITEDDAGNSLKGIMLLGIAKNRNGRVGDIPCVYTEGLTSFSNYQYSAQ